VRHLHRLTVQQLVRGAAIQQTLPAVAFQAVPDQEIVPLRGPLDGDRVHRVIVGPGRVVDPRLVRAPYVRCHLAPDGTHQRLHGLIKAEIRIGARRARVRLHFVVLGEDQKVPVVVGRGLGQSDDPRVRLGARPGDRYVGHRAQRLDRGLDLPRTPTGLNRGRIGGCAAAVVGRGIVTVEQVHLVQPVRQPHPLDAVIWRTGVSHSGDHDRLQLGRPVRIENVLDIPGPVVAVERLNRAPRDIGRKRVLRRIDLVIATVVPIRLPGLVVRTQLQVDALDRRAQEVADRDVVRSRAGIQHDAFDVIERQGVLVDRQDRGIAARRLGQGYGVVQFVERHLDRIDAAAAPEGRRAAGAGVPNDPVVARAAVDVARTSCGVDHVVVRVAVDRVAARAGGKLIIPVAAANHVVPFAAVDHVAVEVTHLVVFQGERNGRPQTVGFRRSLNRPTVLVVVGERRPIQLVDRRDPSVAVGVRVERRLLVAAINRVVSAVGRNDVETRAAVDHVGAGAAEDHVVAGAAVQSDA